MKQKIGQVFEWVEALFIVVFVVSMLFILGTKAYMAGEATKFTNNLVEQCEHFGGNIELVKWEYGCARGDIKDIPCLMVQCIQK